MTNVMLPCSKIRIHCRVTWFCPKQSCSRNRPFILSTWFAHAHSCVVSAPNFVHKNLHFINATSIEKYWLRRLVVWMPLNMRDKRRFAGSCHMVRNKLRWDAHNQVGRPKQRNSYQSSLTFLCFESYFRPSVIYSVPYDRILQTAYYWYYWEEKQPRKSQG